MKILIVSDWYSESMGYSENFLPMAFGKLNQEVHLVTSNLQVYATSTDYDKVYKNKLGNSQTKTGVFKNLYFTLHRNYSEVSRYGINIIGLEEKIKKLNPDVIYCFEINLLTTALLAKLKPKYNFCLFCESRMHSSVFSPPTNLISKVKFWISNRHFWLEDVINNVDIFYPIAPDVYFNITNYFCIPSDKCKLASLSVETGIFNSERNEVSVTRFREKLGFGDADIVCVYTGRFTADKGPLILGQAIDYLHEIGYVFIKGLFIGCGDADYQSQLQNCKGCTTLPFVEPKDLPNIYHSSDIGVWPLQESTSQLDAMACGLPIIVNDTVEDVDRFEGNGMRFKKNDFKDLAKKILILVETEQRVNMGAIGANRIKQKYSWEVFAQQRLVEFFYFINKKCTLL
ncbi:glycosyltransferase [Methylomonas sp. LW13]|uniref:glycosyltransferase family 4 protein n=1 Tax=unclassified Methylomonas TaxID=2608980 RepID=UPI00051AF7AA|nr:MULTISPECIES: glycosyltransferase family 4 protein [unclassified Methylomonas]PKD39945.1 hypothetical protein CWO84_12715 [Methylomonas sp. Kb3]QBC27281.1 glycosyltransferase [Methylomonas sp. LW13]